MQYIRDEELQNYIVEKLKIIPLQDFLTDVTLEELTEAEQEIDDSVVSDAEARYFPDLSS